MSLIIFTVVLLVSFLGRRIYTEATDRAAKGPGDDIIYFQNLDFQKTFCNIPHDTFLLKVQDDTKIQGRTQTEIQNRLKNSKTVTIDSSCERSYVKQEKVFFKVHRG